MKKDYPWIVVPRDKNAAKKLGISSTFCKTRLCAEGVCCELNKYSGTSWYVKETEDETLNWNIDEHGNAINFIVNE